MKQQLLLLDWGGVLGLFSPDVLCEKTAKFCKSTPKEIFQFLRQKDNLGRTLYERLETETKNKEDIYNVFMRAFGFFDRQMAFYKAFSSGFYVTQNHWRYMSAILNATRNNGHLIGLISNTNVIHREMVICGRYNYMLQYMQPDLVFFSYEIGMRKNSEVAIFNNVYEYIRQRYDISRARITLVDDRYENLIGCRKAGMRGIFYRYGETLMLEEALHKLGFI